MAEASVRPFEGQVAIVTGGASGIGRATALRLAAGGAAVAVVDKNRAGDEETVRLLAEAGGRGLAIEANVSDAEDVRNAVARTVQELGAPSVLINDAGVTGGGPIAEIADDVWDRTLAVNLRSCFLFCKHVVPLMVERGYGRIVSVASSTAVRVGPGTGPYAASKAGIIALTKAVAAEVAEHGVTVNVIAPGITDTAMTRGQFGSEERLREMATSGRIANPMRVVIEPRDIAAAIAFFASPESRYITGQTLHVNAGAFMP